MLAYKIYVDPEQRYSAAVDAEGYLSWIPLGHLLIFLTFTLHRLL